ncbi:16S rRNA (uracil(1498)-N(3))-methyltransferase [Echinicola sp. CAU 1574]|uniref:Ribosomal RNA small subunit methyltransferase E n=1 Tax=Echinicola arenosa TaxID=2774144 RepID=A0ABR9AP54_9BACT|nr:16S rRNA (uracil(1498)-N(3))-methyltransferase [Echinicola arenosa]MBD8490567.1 16S rRNA (uracil(1498)-N(3))-methyltransferase [Echinicola arenosa]
MQLFFQKNIKGDKITLDPDESKHLSKVLRKSVGDEIHITNGNGELFTCIIESISLKSTVLNIIKQEKHTEDNFYIHLAIAPTKNNDRVEWMLEKITEIGFHELTFIKTQNSERTFLKPDRLEKKMIAACKQSLKTRIPKINPIITFQELINKNKTTQSQKFIAYVDQNNQKHLYDLANCKQSYLVLIGPEGDFSEDEIDLAFDNGFKACSLGDSRLRTETAGLAAVHTLSLKNYQS